MEHLVILVQGVIYLIYLINFIWANISQRFGGAKTQMYNRTINEILPKRPRSRMGKIFGKSY